MTWKQATIHKPQNEAKQELCEWNEWVGRWWLVDRCWL